MNTNQLAGYVPTVLSNRSKITSGADSNPHASSPLSYVICNRRFTNSATNDPRMRLKNIHAARHILPLLACFITVTVNSSTGSIYKVLIHDYVLPSHRV